MSLKVDIAVAKVQKYAQHESGDSVEVVERPRGGISVVMVDGQRSGRSAKAISNIAVQKAISLLADGVRDGAVARATHDYLRTQRGGQVSAELSLVSVDFETHTLVISRNSRCPVLLHDEAGWRLLDDPAAAVGTRSQTRPVIIELPLAAGQTVVAFTDGLTHAGSRTGRSIDLMGQVSEMSGPGGCTAEEACDRLLAMALELDDGRPADDITVVVLQVLPDSASRELQIRRMRVDLPIPPV